MLHSKVRYVIVLLTVMMVVSVAGCGKKQEAQKEQDIANRIYKETEEEYANLMLEFMEDRWHKEFKIVDQYLPNDAELVKDREMLWITVEDPEGRIANVSSTKLDPYYFADTYMYTICGEELMSKLDIPRERIDTIRIYPYVRNIFKDNSFSYDDVIVDISPENVSFVYVLAKIPDEPSEINLMDLFYIYLQLSDLEYKDIEILAAFTEEPSGYDRVVRNWPVYSNGWLKEDFGDHCHGTLWSVGDDLTFKEFCSFLEEGK